MPILSAVVSSFIADASDQFWRKRDVVSLFSLRGLSPVREGERAWESESAFAFGRKFRSDAKVGPCFTRLASLEWFRVH